MLCLDERAQDLDALIGALEHADAQAVGHAVDAASALRPLADCADQKALLQRASLPSSAEARKQLALIKGGIARVKALADLGMFTPARDLAQATLPAARRLEDRSVLAELLIQFGLAQSQSSDLPGVAKRSLLEAVALAEQAGDDRTAAAALSWLVALTGIQEHQVDEAETLSALAFGMLDRIGERGQIRFDLLNNLGRFHVYTRQNALALANHQEALAIGERIYGPEDPRLGEPLLGLGNVLAYQDDDAQALAYIDRAASMTEKLHGPEHDDMAIVLLHRAKSFRSLKRFDESVENLNRALRIFTITRGPDHPYVVSCLVNLGRAYLLMKRLADARRALEDAARRQDGARHWTPSKMAADLAMARAGLELADHHPTAALGYAREALKLCEAGDPNPADVAQPLIKMGEVHLARRQPGEAANALERALKLLEGQDAARDRANAQFLLARSLWEVGDKVRARKLAGAARAKADEELHVDDWIRAHSP
jgi:tetratricopeptide (TPR) repeat protein